MTGWRLLGLGALAAVAALGFGALATGPVDRPSALVGKPAPALVLPRLDAPQQRFAATELQGRVWLLNVWASWCAPCRDEHPQLVSVARAAKVPIVGLNYRDDPRAAQEWLIRLGDPYLATVSDRDGDASLGWGVQAVPQTFVIDRQGVVRLNHAGPLTPEVWSNRIEPLLRQLQG